jgi:hypothetical protein
VLTVQPSDVVVLQNPVALTAAVTGGLVKLMISRTTWGPPLLSYELPVQAPASNSTAATGIIRIVLIPRIV